MVALNNHRLNANTLRPCNIALRVCGITLAAENTAKAVTILCLLAVFARVVGAFFIECIIVGVYLKKKT